MNTRGRKLDASSWHTIHDLNCRSIGLEAGGVFREKAVGSKSFVQRLCLAEKLEFHDGCVNSLNFNEAGSLLASGSDDCNIAVWNWQKSSKPKLTYDSGHNSNVFQVRWYRFGVTTEGRCKCWISFAVFQL